VRGLLNIAKSESLDADSSASQLLTEMNAYIEDLNSWKEQRKQRETALDQALPKPILPLPTEEPLDLPEAANVEMDLEALKAVCETRRIDVEALLRDLNRPKAYNLSEGEFKGSDLFEIGQKLKEKLRDDSEVDLNLASSKPAAVSHSGEAWEAVDEIERELQELEKELSEVQFSSSKAV